MKKEEPQSYWMASNSACTLSFNAECSGSVPYPRLAYTTDFHSSQEVFVAQQLATGWNGIQSEGAAVVSIAVMDCPTDTENPVAGFSHI